MKKILIILLFITTPLQAEKIEQLSWFNLQELLEDDNLTYKIIKSCVSLNSAVTDMIVKPCLALSYHFFKFLNITCIDSLFFECLDWSWAFKFKFLLCFRFDWIHHIFFNISGLI